MQANEEGLLPWSFEVKFTVSVDVKNINDDFVSKEKVIEAAKAAANAELLRQAQMAIAEGMFDV